MVIEEAIGQDIKRFAKKEPRREENVLKDYTLEDESSPQGVDILLPFKPTRGQETDIAVENELDYLSRTRSLETNTERTRILQNILDAMSKGMNVESRVSIMNKGGEPEAFTLPDGSILVSQPLINSLDSLDEVGGVLAHELGHIINKSSERKQGAGAVGHLGVCWAHEEASDSLAPVLLEKAGLNTFGFSSAIQKVSHGERGIEHQSGYSRASQNVGMHIGIDFTTSSQETTKIPENLKTDKVKRTNHEIVTEAIKEQNPKIVEEALPLLHPRDLAYMYERATLQVDYFKPEVEVQPEQMQILEKFHTYFTQRLSSAGFDQRAINVFFLLTQYWNMKPTDFSMISTPEVLVQAAKDFPSIIDNKEFDKMHESLFGKVTQFGIYDQGTLNQLLNNIRYHFYDINHSSEPHGIPVTAESLLTVLSTIDKTPNSNKYFSARETKERSFAEVLHSYIAKVYAGKEYDYKIQNTDEVREFLRKAKDLGIPVDYRYLKEHSWGLSNEIVKLFDEVFSERPKGLYEQIDAFIVEYGVTTDVLRKPQILESFLKNFREQINEQKMPDSERLKFVIHLESKVKLLDFTSSVDLISRRDLRVEENVNKQEFNKKLRDFNLIVIGALSIFEKDGPEFYQYMNRYFNDCGIDPNDMSYSGLINISYDLLNVNNFASFRLLESGRLGDTVSVGKKIEINHYDQFLQLPFLSNIVRESQNRPRFDTLGELNTHIDEENRSLYSRSGIYDDSLQGIIVGERARENALDLLRIGVSEQEHNELYTFIERDYPQGPQKTRFLREIKNRYIQSPEISLDDKINYLISNFDDIGPDGMVRIAEQITTLRDYRRFRERIKDRLTKYLEGSTRGSEIAALDVVTSEFGKKFDLVIKSTITDKKTKRDVNNGLAEAWKNGYFNRSLSDGLDYDKNSGKIIVDAIGRQTFRTLSDSIESFHNLSPFQRFAIAQKALVDKDGALTTEENRKLLGHVLVDSLGIKSGFINSALRFGAETAPADFFSIPAAQMLSPLLFKGFDVNAVDMRGIRYRLDNVHGIPPTDVLRLMKSTTREVVTYGAGYLKDPQSNIARLAIESDQEYTETANILETMLTRETKGEEKESTDELDLATEAVIKAVEASGALGVRSLQLARQLHHFSPAVDRRLSQAFDARPGLNKLLFWENLTKLADQDEDGQLRDFIENRLVTLDDILGGGSLYTTFGATVKDEQGEIRDGVIKLLNPNPTVFIGTTYEATKKVFDMIEESGTGKDKKYARMGQIFMDLSQQWCLRDINDPNFVEDDNAFQHTIDTFNHKRGKEVFYKPDRLVTTYRLKSEEKAHGRTLNKLLNDDTVDPNIKKQVVGDVEDFFMHQLETPSGVDENGEPYYLVHSDPHVGNYIVGTNDNEYKIGVIDRSMYLRLSSQDAKLFSGLMKSGNYRSFISPFIDRVMDHNNMINDQVRNSIKSRIMRAMTLEYVKQGIQSAKGLSLHVDNFALLKKILDEFSKAELDVPLEIRLMIRNIEAFKELDRRYNA